ncbi:MAG: hypothetical protein ACRDPG_12460 [Nocardioidaceae bacterium]
MTAGDRDGSLDEMADQLWPHPLRWRYGGSDELPSNDVMTEYVITPNARSPRLVVPATPRLAGRVAMAEGFGRPLAKRAKSTALATAFRLRLGDRLFRDRLRIYAPAEGEIPSEGIRSHLGHVLGQPVHIAFQVTRARANRKPVLRLLDGRGSTLGFVKVGANDLTRDLVRAEGRALQALASVRFEYTTVPQVISSHAWNGQELLVLAPLPMKLGTSQPRRGQPLRSAKELASSSAIECGPLSPSAYWTDLRARVGNLRPSHDRGTICAALDSLQRSLAGLDLPFSAWHGDWAPWNLARDGDRLLVWDLERYRTCVPMGFDLVHYELQTKILAPRRDPYELIMEAWPGAAALLAPMGLSRSQSEGAFALYLAEISTRWVADRQSEAGDWGGVLDAMVRALTTIAELVDSRASAH